MNSKIRTGKRSFINERTFRIVGIPLIGIIVYLFILVLTPLKENPLMNIFHIFTDILCAIIISFLVWEGNLIINTWIDKYFDWKKKARKRLFYQILFNSFYSISVMVLVIFIYMTIINYPFNKAIPFLKITFFTGTIVFLLIDTIYIGMYFYHQWEKLNFESEELKRQSLQSQLEALKNQVNPHFLFNSLNALTTIISEDQNLAIEFVQRLANVYRYVLQSKDKELIELRDELNFIDAFIFLQKARFGDNIDIKINIAQEFESFFIAPLTLQLLVENAIKHNIVSSEKPLIINIFVEQGMLIVQNNLQKKYNSISSTNIGLQNIQQRYYLISKKDINILEESKQFTVKIPLIKEKSFNLE
ncbi:MAG: sensor histidine kinase [Methanococcaceae archaeon]